MQKLKKFWEVFWERVLGGILFGIFVCFAESWRRGEWLNFGYPILAFALVGAFIGVVEYRTFLPRREDSGDTQVP